MNRHSLAAPAAQTKLIPFPAAASGRGLSKLYLLLFSVTLLWGSSYAVAKIGMQDMLPLNLAILRFLLASFLFTLIIFVKTGFPRLDYKDIPRFFQLGFAGIALFYYLHYTGLQYTSSTHAGLIMSTAPAFAALWSFLTHQESVRINSLLGIGTAFAGIGLVITQGNVAALHSQNSWFGDSLLLITAILWAWFTLQGKPLLQKYSPLAAMAYIHIFGTLLLLPLALWPNPFVSVTLWQELPKIGWSTLLASVYLAFCCSVYGYFIWYLGVAQIGAVRTSLFQYFTPLTATLIGALLFSETITIYTLAGAALVLCGVFLAQQTGNQPLAPVQHVFPCRKKLLHSS